MGTLEGKVAFITGAARGQGRSHAVRLAGEGADIIAVDLCKDIDSMPYPMATAEDLDETVRQVEGLGRSIYGTQADVRDRVALQAAFDEGVAQIGGPNIVIANAGVAPMSVEEHADVFFDVVDINLTGSFNTAAIAVPGMIERGQGGSIVFISSTAGLKGILGNSDGGLGYTASKHGVVGLMRAYANYLAPYSIRVNTVHPTGTNTLMSTNDAVMEVISASPSFTQLGNAMPVEMLEPIEISNAIAWLVSEQAHYVTGITFPVDAGYTNNR